MRERSLTFATRAVANMERQRDEARARGDTVEAQRLEALIRVQRERIANLQAAPADLPMPPRRELPTE